MTQDMSSSLDWSSDVKNVSGSSSITKILKNPFVLAAAVAAECLPLMYCLSKNVNTIY